MLTSEDVARFPGARQRLREFVARRPQLLANIAPMDKPGVNGTICCRRSTRTNTGIFGGNSNWRGPVWLPVNLLLVRALLQFYLHYGDSFRVECPTGSGRQCTLFEIAREISERLTRIFLRNTAGERPVYGANERFQKDPHFRDLLTFYEYFQADTGAGLGASHQTGWTGSVAKLIQLFGSLTPEAALGTGHAYPSVANYNE